MASSGPLVLDATVLSNFASTASITWLVGLIDEPVVTSAVEEELERGRTSGHTFLEDATRVIGRGIALVEPPSARDVEPLRERLDPGEAQSIATALAHGGWFASDDAAARTVAREQGLSVTGSVGLLTLGIERGVLDIETADEWLETWRRERSYYAPVRRISDALHE